jgi:hypothetical protein
LIQINALPAEMTDFAVWLRGRNAAQDASLLALQKFADSQGATWPYGTNDVGEYIIVITANASDAARDGLLTALAGGVSGGVRYELPRSIDVGDDGALADMAACFDESTATNT